ncbi:MAG: ribosomal RNA small subunit methyltransferase A [Pyrinomonadaceae bacterium]|nr:ribosomal RNA small subunit methyltransferase A [Pyrinomonadaceae bacterium]
MSRSRQNKSYAKKSLGQNFLADQNYVEKLIVSLDPKRDETIVEIGAGRGALTKKLVHEAGKVLAIEIDRDLTPILRDEFGDHDNFHLIEQDALELDFKSLLALQSIPLKTKLVANLPYYISTAILQHLISFRKSISEMVLMLQKEVVERITARPGTRERGFLTVLIEAYFEAENLFDVPPDAFRPAPKVWSSVIRLRPKSGGFPVDEELFRDVVSLGFGQKRKTILNNLKNAKGDLGERIESKGGVNKTLKETGVDPGQRAETIDIDHWIELADYLSGNDPDN